MMPYSQPHHLLLLPLQQTFHGAIQFTAYEELKYFVAQRRQSVDRRGPGVTSSSASPPGQQPSSVNSGSGEPGLQRRRAAADHDGRGVVSGNPGGGGTETSTSGGEVVGHLGGSRSGATSAGTPQASPSGQQRRLHPPLSSLETSVCAVLSKLAASVVTYPTQVIR